MVALISVETVLLVMLVVLVAGLLRSHAEILRRLGEHEAVADGTPAPPAIRSAPERVRTGTEMVAAPITGTTPSGDAITLSFDRSGSEPTLLAFLTSGCGTCEHFWSALGERRLPAGLQTLIVTRGSDRERPSRLRSLAPKGVPVVMSSEAWNAYGVPGTPYFVFVDGFVRGEGVAGTWDALASLVGDAIEDQREAERREPGSRARQIEETLAAAGIGPGHPSLYPGSQSED